MANYAEALEALSKLENGSDLTEAIRAEVRKKNDEASGLRKRLKPLEDRVRKLAGADESDDLDSVFEKIEAATKAGDKGGKPDERYTTLERTVADLKKELALKEAKATAAIVGGKVKDALAKHKGKRPDDLLKLVLDRVKVDGDNHSFLQDDGTEADLDTGIKSWLEARPEFVASEQQPGPGGSGTRNQSPGGTKTINRAAYTQAQQSQDKATLAGVASGTIKISD